MIMKVGRWEQGRMAEAKPGKYFFFFTLFIFLTRQLGWPEMAQRGPLAQVIMMRKITFMIVITMRKCKYCVMFQRSLVC